LGLLWKKKCLTSAGTGLVAVGQESMEVCTFKKEGYFEIGMDTIDLGCFSFGEVQGPNIFHDCYIILSLGT